MSDIRETLQNAIDAIDILEAKVKLRDDKIKELEQQSKKLLEVFEVDSIEDIFERYEIETTENDALRKINSELEKEREMILNFVNEQAEDEGLWCVAQYASEAYMQTALRRLHSVIESNFKGYKV